MARKTLLLIAELHSQYVAPLKKHYTVQHVRDGKQGLAWAKEQSVLAVVLDAVSLGTSGERIIASFRKQHSDLPLIHIQSSPTQTHSTADTVLIPPLSARKLLSVVALYDNQRHQTASSGLLCAGPFRLDTQTGLLSAHGQEIQLSPKQALLMALFLRCPNQVLTRDWLMQQAWQTDYVGDTRTLNVHIRWLRDVIETNKAHPHYLQTVRGTGYCLVVPSGETGNKNGP